MSYPERNELYKAAIEYRKRGWNVFPLRQNSQIPAIPWKDFQTRLSTDKELYEWFQVRGYNIAITTGKTSSLLAVDVDDNSLTEKWLSDYPTNCCVKTPRGMHMYYEAPKEEAVHNSTGKLGRGIDTRGEGGYVVAPPSMVKGKKYVWVSDGFPSIAPRELMESIRQRRTDGTQGKEIGNVGGLVPEEDGIDLSIRVMREGFTEGQHNNEIKDVGRFLFRSGMEEYYIRSILSSLNSLDKTPQPEHELVATLSSGIGYEKKRLGDKRKDGEKVEANSNSFSLMNLLDVLSNYSFDSTRWLIEGWLPENTVMALVAPPENYKTWIALEMAVSVAYGQRVSPFLGQASCEKSWPVMIVQQEDSIRKVAERVRVIIDSKYDMKDRFVHDGENYGFTHPWMAPIYFHTESSLRFGDDRVMAGFEKKIRDLGVKFVVLDPFYWLEDVDESHFAKAATGGMQELKRMRSEYGISFLLVHHTRKSGRTSDSVSRGREEIYGSQLLNAAFEGVMVINNDGNKTSLLRQGKVFQEQMRYDLEIQIENTDRYEERFADPENSGENISESDKIPNYSIKAFPSGRMFKYTHTEKILECIKNAGSEGIREKPISDFTGIARRSLINPLKELISMGYIEKDDYIYREVDRNEEGAVP